MLRPYFFARDAEHRAREINADRLVARCEKIKHQVTGAARQFEDARADDMRDCRACPIAPMPARDKRADKIVGERKGIVEEAESKAQKRA